MTALGESAPDRERIIAENGWRAALAFNSTLPGWLVLVPLRHVEAVDDLSDDEAAELGRLTRRVTAALRAVVGCEKTYVMLFAEAPGFSHLHVHVAPRMADFPVDVRGPRVFAFMTDDESKWIVEADRDDLARRLRTALASWG